MSKTLKKPSIDLERIVMAKVKSNEISMKPRWYFFLGSLLMMAGLAGFGIGAVFLTNLTLFLLRRHGPMGQWRLQQFLTSFPMWVPILAVFGMASGIWMLRKYDFSYKKNFGLIIIGFILSVFLAAFVIDNLGLNELWLHRRQIRRIYQKFEDQNPVLQRNPGQGKGQGQGRYYQLNQ